MHVKQLLSDPQRVFAVVLEPFEPVRVISVVDPEEVVRLRGGEQ